MKMVQDTLKTIGEKLPGILQELMECKDLTYAAAAEDPDNPWIKEMHKRLWESEVAARQTQDILTTLTRTELAEDD